MTLIKEGEYIRTYYGYNDEVKGGLIDNYDCVNTTDKCQVLDNAMLKHNAWISGNAIVKDDAVMEGYAHAGHNVVVSGKSHIKGYICLGGGKSVNDPVIVVDNVDIEVCPLLYLTISKSRQEVNTGIQTEFVRDRYTVYVSPRICLNYPRDVEICVTIAYRHRDGIEYYKVLQDVTADEIKRMKADGWKVETGDPKQTSEKLKQWTWRYSKL